MRELSYSEIEKIFGGRLAVRTLSPREAAALEKEFACETGPGGRYPAGKGKMRLARGDAWTLAKGKSLAITTNGSIKKNGSAVMGRGVALQAAQRFPELPRRLGSYLQKYGNRCFYLGKWESYILLSFPTKHAWHRQSDLELIRRSAAQIVKIADKFGLTEIYLPRPGCGEGGLAWKDVEPILNEILDGRFVVCVKT